MIQGTSPEFRDGPPKKAGGSYYQVNLPYPPSHFVTKSMACPSQAKMSIVVASRVLTVAFIRFCGMVRSVMDGLDIIGLIRRLAFPYESLQGFRSTQDRLVSWHRRRTKDATQSLADSGLCPWFIISPGQSSQLLLCRWFKVFLVRSEVVMHL
jgi:hypothetical protein